MQERLLMKCNLGLLQENNITCSFLTLLIGVKYNLLDRVEIENYTTHYLLQNPEETNPCITELTFLQKNENDIAFLISQALTKKEKNIRSDSQEWFIEKRKLRLCLLLNLKKSIPDHRALLERIAEVYAYFDYPSDMEEFVYYMPAKNYDPSKHSLEENEQRLIVLFNLFLEKEKEYLQNISKKIHT
jgi:hypothetical protein